MDIPQTIENFFEMKNGHDYDGIVSLFADDAVVVDAGEGKTLRGNEEINAWVRKSIAGLDLHTEIQDSKKIKNEWIVDTVMTGNFKASPASFQYFITLDGDKISALRVEFRGSLKK